MPLSGLIPPLVTPLHPDGTLDGSSLARQARAVVGAGASGVWLNGTTGEFHAFTATQVAEVVRVVADALGSRVPIVAQVGAPATGLAVERAIAAEANGATALAAVTPYYLDYSPQEMAGYYRSIRAAVDLPLLVYQVPAMTGVLLDVDTVMDLVREGTVIGIKDSSGQVSWLRRLLERAAHEGLTLRAFAGGGGLVDATIFAGASGAMCAIANVVPAHCAALVAAARAGEVEEARALQGGVYRLERSLELDTLVRWAPTVGIYKAVLRLRGIIDTDTCAPPGRPLDRAMVERLRATALPLVERMEADAGADAGADDVT